METGRIFDTKEFAIYDGDGIRVTYFLQGCPLRCEWCHNPEGQDMNGGQERSSGEVLDEIRGYAKLWGEGGGGITFSGGEALMQDAFLVEILGGIRDMAVAVKIDAIAETSAAVPEEVFRRVMSRADLAYVDLKICDEAEHIRYTGRSCRQILDNIRWLAATDIPAVIRIPMIPGVSATAANYRRTAEFLAGLERKLPVELLPYNTFTKAKYDAIGREYRIHFDADGPVCGDISIFRQHGISCTIL